ncbi:MAG: choice-of-anchor B family protein, partial [Gemmatimonadota bacterium]
MPRPVPDVRPVSPVPALLALLAMSAAVPAALPAQQLYDFGSAFGRSAAVAGGDLLVAEPQAVTRPGRVYVFRAGPDGGWVESAILTASDAVRGDGFGRAIAASGALLAAGAPRAADGRGGVYLFRSVAGQWIERARFPAGEDALAAGSAVAVSPRWVAFAEETEDGGRVRVHAVDGENGSAPGVLRPEPGDAFFGAALAVLPDGALAVCGADAERRTVLSVFAPARAGGFDLVALGVPRAGNGRGQVHLYRRQGDGPLRPEAVLEPVAPEGTVGLGAAVAVAGGVVWAGAPGSAGRLGAAARYERDDDGEWRGTAVEGRGRDFMPVFGLALAAGPDAAVIGSPGDDYGAGTALVFHRSSGSTWTEGAELTVEGERYERVSGERRSCAQGTASVFTCASVDLVSLIPVQELGGSRGAMLNDVWGWTDPETGREYAVVGRSDGTSFVDVTDPAGPVVVGNLPKTEGSRGNAWRDVKVIRDHAVIVADNAGPHGMQVFDLTRLRDAPRDGPRTFAPDALYTEVASAHNLVVNEETGFAYTVGNSDGGRACGSLHMIDMRDPKNPRFAGCYTDPSVGLGNAGQTHDAQCVVYQGPDEAYRGREICIGFAESAITIGDVTDKDAPRVLSQGRYPNSAYVHQGWLTDDHRYLYINDELDEMNGLTERTRTLIWDVSELEDPILAGEYLGETRASDHNLYVRGDLMYQSNYAAGLRLIDISDPE